MLYALYETNVLNTIPFFGVGRWDGNNNIHIKYKLYIYVYFNYYCNGEIAKFPKSQK